MGAETVSLFGLPISRMGVDAAVHACQSRLADGAGGYGCFVNVHTLTESTRDSDLRTALAGATYRFADGIPLVWLSALLEQPIDERVAGPDFMETMLRKESGRTHGFIGGVSGCAEALAARFGVESVCYSTPMRHYSSDTALEDWAQFLTRCPGGIAPRIVWIGLGAPKQERWIETVAREAPDVFFLGVGAAFDFLSGASQRAPSWMRRAGFEWAHRLASEPRRLWRRYLHMNRRFLALSYREVLFGTRGSAGDGQRYRDSAKE